MSLKPLPFFACLLAGAAASATEPPVKLEPVLVTATLRPMPVSERAGGVTVLTTRDVREAAVVHLEELLPQVPSLSWAGASSRPRYFQLRGIGELEQYQGAPNPSVGFLVDEIDFSGIGMIASTFDVEQVEVLRGPQGTRYGANALGGLIKVKTRDAQPLRELDTELSVGGDGFWSAGAVAGGRLDAGEALSGAWRAVLQRAVGDGFRNNRYLGRDDTNGRDETTARLKLRLASEGAWRADVALLHADFDNRYDAFAIDNSFDTLSDRPGRDAQRSDGASLDLAFDGAGRRQWRSITAFAESDIVASFDGDWGNDRDWGDAGPYDYFSSTRRVRRTASEDLRLSGETAAGHAWITGLWLQRLEEDNHVADDGRYLADAFVRLLDSRYRATSAALYGQADFALAPATTFTAGLRGEERDASYADSDGVSFDPRERLWGGELSVLHRVGERRSVWATLARGYRAGGFNIGTSVPGDRQRFAAEYLWSIEAGWKGESAAGDRRADVNVYLPAAGTPAGLDVVAARSRGPAHVHVPDRQRRRAPRLSASNPPPDSRSAAGWTWRRRSTGWIRATTAIASATATSRAAHLPMPPNGKRRSLPPGATLPGGWRVPTSRARRGSISTPATTSAPTRASSRTSARVTRPSAGRSKPGCATCSTSVTRSGASGSATSRPTFPTGSTCAGAIRGRRGLPRAIPSEVPPCMSPSK